MNLLQKIYHIIFKEGIIYYIKRKLNISYLDSKTTFTVRYRNRDTKIVLNRAFGYVDMLIFRDGIYEKEIVDDICEVLSKDKTLLDIGANIGQHSLLLSPYCKQIYAFEPIPEVFEQFQESIRKNHFTNIKCFNIGISDKKESKSFNFVKNHAGTSSFVKREEKDITERITVHTDTLQNVLGDKKIDAVKIDVEGYEAVVVLGNQDFILKNRPVVFLEFSPHWIVREGTHTPKELFDFFIDNGFEIFSRTFDRVVTAENVSLEHQDNWIIKPVL